MHLIEALNAFGSYFVGKTYQLDNSFTKQTFAAYKKSNSIHLKFWEFLNDLTQNFEFDTISEAICTLFNKLEENFLADKENYLKDKETQGLSQLLNYLISDNFKLTNFSKRFSDDQLKSLIKVKNSINSIFIDTVTTPKPVLTNNRTTFQTGSNLSNEATAAANNPIQNATPLNLENFMEQLLLKNAELIKTTLSSVVNQLNQNQNKSVVFSQQNEINLQSSNPSSLNPQHLETIVKNKSKTLALKLNHIENNEKHIQNGTTPASLFFNRFPIPFLKNNHRFIDGYNNLISEFQVATLNLTNAELRIETELIENELSSLTFDNPTILTHEKMNEINTNISNSLTEHFENKANKVYTIKKWVVTEDYIPDPSQKYRKNNYSYNNSNKSYNSNNSNNSSKYQSTPKRKRYQSFNNNGNNNNNNRNNNNNNRNNNNNNSNRNNNFNYNYNNNNKNHEYYDDDEISNSNNNYNKNNNNPDKNNYSTNDNYNSNNNNNNYNNNQRQNQQQKNYSYHQRQFQQK